MNEIFENKDNLENEDTIENEENFDHLENYNVIKRRVIKVLPEANLIFCSKMVVDIVMVPYKSNHALDIINNSLNWDVCGNVVNSSNDTDIKVFGALRQ